jgi:hypothetical protein
MEQNLAVLIDFENIAAGTEKEGLGRFNIEALMQRINDKGRILIARSYADWGRFSRFKQSLLTNNVTMIELTSHGMQDKNRADIAMVVDCLELALTKDYIDAFVVVSGDSDFTPLVLKMRELNKRVIGCGTRKSTSRLLIQACDEFFFYDTVVKPRRSSNKRAPSRNEPLNKKNAYELLVVSIEGLQRENPDPPLASVIKSAMRRKSPDFSEGDLGFNSFTRFLDSAQEAGHVQITRDRKSGGYRVEVSDDRSGNGGDHDNTHDSGAFVDEYIPEGAAEFVSTLAAVGLHPLGGPTRMATLETIEQVVAERKKRRRKVNIPFVAEDVKKKLRRTHPDMPMTLITGLMHGLMHAGVLMHRQGSPIRSASASFSLKKTAEELNTALVNVYLKALIKAGSDLSNSALLADLFLGDPERNRDVEESIAWLATQPDEEVELSVEEEAPPLAELDDVDLDDLLVAQADGAATPEVIEAPAETLDIEAAVVETPEVAPETPAEEAADVTAAPVIDVEEAAAEKPKRKRVRRRPKKEVEEAKAAKAAKAAAEASP